MKTRLLDTLHFWTKHLLAGMIMLALCFPSILDAQCYHKKSRIGFKKGDISLSTGIGLLPTFRGKDLSVPIPPVSTIINYRIRQNVTAGVYFGYSLTEAHLTKKDKDARTDDDDEKVIPKTVRNNFYLAGFRLEGHYISDRVDFYGGAMIAYNFSDIDSNLERYQDYTNIRVENYSDAVTWSGHIGLKYLITKNLGIFTEIGYGVSIFVIGTTVKI